MIIKPYDKLFREICVDERLNIEVFSYKYVVLK